MAKDPAIDQAGELRSARVESLRAIAALGVLVGHTFGRAYDYSPEIFEGFVHRALLGGEAGVLLFFVLSGYLLFWPFARRDLGGGDTLDLRRYAINRALRILPLYYAVLLVLFVFQEHGGTPKEWVIFVSFGQNFSASTIGGVDRVMWSLVVELHFYVLLPLLAFLLARASGDSRGRAALLLGMLGFASFVFFLFAWQLDPTPNPVWRRSLLAFFFFFAAGMLLALVRLSWEERRPGWLRGPLASSDLWMAASASVWALIFWQYSLRSIATIASFLVVGACVLPLRPGPLVRALEWRPLAVVGVASYSLYLWHDPILRTLTKSPWAPSSFLGLLAVGLPLCCLVALVSYALIEAPFLRLRRRWARSTPGFVAERTRILTRADENGGAAQGAQGGRSMARTSLKVAAVAGALAIIGLLFVRGGADRFTETEAKTNTAAGEGFAVEGTVSDRVASESAEPGTDHPAQRRR